MRAILATKKERRDMGLESHIMLGGIHGIGLLKWACEVGKRKCHWDFAYRLVVWLFSAFFFFAPRLGSLESSLRGEARDRMLFFFLSLFVRTHHSHLSFSFVHSPVQSFWMHEVIGGMLGRSSRTSSWAPIASLEKMREIPY